MEKGPTKTNASSRHLMQTSSTLKSNMGGPAPQYSITGTMVYDKNIAVALDHYQ